MCINIYRDICIYDSYVFVIVAVAVAVDAVVVVFSLAIFRYVCVFF